MNTIKTGILDKQDIDDICAELLPLFDLPNWQQSTISSRKTPVNKDIRSSMGMFVDLHHFRNLEQTVGIGLELVASTFGSLFNLKYPSIQLLKYQANDHYNWHIDYLGNDSKTASQRIVSISINLNSEYTGGGIIVEDIGTKQQITAPNVRGGYAVFTSFHRHKAAMVEQGIRKAVTFWFEGDKEDEEKVKELISRSKNVN